MPDLSSTFSSPKRNAKPRPPAAPAPGVSLKLFPAYSSALVTPSPSSNSKDVRFIGFVNIPSAYIAQGEVLPVATRSFGGIGIFAIPEMGRFYRHVLIEKNYPHHGAVAFGHFGKALYEVFKYIGVPVEDINYNQPKGVRYPTENPFA